MNLYCYFYHNLQLQFSILISIPIIAINLTKISLIKAGTALTAINVPILFRSVESMVILTKQK